MYLGGSGTSSRRSADLVILRLSCISHGLCQSITRRFNHVQMVSLLSAAKQPAIGGDLYATRVSHVTSTRNAHDSKGINPCAKVDKRKNRCSTTMYLRGCERYQAASIYSRPGLRPTKTSTRPLQKKESGLAKKVSCSPCVSIVVPIRVHELKQPVNRIASLRRRQCPSSLDPWLVTPILIAVTAPNRRRWATQLHRRPQRSRWRVVVPNGSLSSNVVRSIPHTTRARWPCSRQVRRVQQRRESRSRRENVRRLGLRRRGRLFGEHGRRRESGE